MEGLFSKLLYGLYYLEEYPLNVKNKHEVYDVSRFALTPFCLKLPIRTSHDLTANQKKEEDNRDKSLRAENSKAKEIVRKSSARKSYVKVTHKRFDSDELNDAKVKFPYNEINPKEEQKLLIKTQYPRRNTRYVIVVNIGFLINILYI